MLDFDDYLQKYYDDFLHRVRRQYSEELSSRAYELHSQGKPECHKIALAEFMDECIDTFCAVKRHSIHNSVKGVVFIRGYALGKNLPCNNLQDDVLYEIRSEAYAYPEHYFKYREVPEDEDCITIKNGETLKLVPVLDAPADYASYVKNAKETESIKKSNSF